MKVEGARPISDEERRAEYETGDIILQKQSSDYKEADTNFKAW